MGGGGVSGCIHVKYVCRVYGLGTKYLITKGTGWLGTKQS